MGTTEFVIFSMAQSFSSASVTGLAKPWRLGSRSQYLLDLSKGGGPAEFQEVQAPNTHVADEKSGAQVLS